jgi:hypothetical protein
MSIKHVYNQTIADGTATSVVRPSDWNSNHNMIMNLSGNTLGSSQVSGQDIILVGGNNLTLSADTAASKVVFSAPAASSLVAGNNITLSTNGSTISVIGAAGGGGYTQSFYQPELYGAPTTQSHANGTLYLRPFELNGYADIDRILMQQSMSMSATTISFSCSISGPTQTSGTASFGQTGTVILFSRAQTSEGAASYSSLQSFFSASTSMSIGISATVSGSTNASNATLNYTTQQQLGYLKNIDTTGGYTTSSIGSTTNSSFSSSSTAGSTYSSSIGATFGNNMLSGIRPFHAPGIATPVAPGEYWIGVIQSSTSSSTGLAIHRPVFPATLGQLYFTASTNNTYLEVGNSANVSTSNWRMGFGSYSASSNTTGQIALTQVSTNASNASLYFAGIGHAL